MFDTYRHTLLYQSQVLIGAIVRRWAVTIVPLLKFVLLCLQYISQYLLQTYKLRPKGYVGLILSGWTG